MEVIIRLWIQNESPVSNAIKTSLHLRYPEFIKYQKVCFDQPDFLYEYPAIVYIVEGDLLDSYVRFHFPNALCIKLSDAGANWETILKKIDSKLKNWIEKEDEVNIFTDHFQFVHFPEEPIWHDLKNGFEIEQNITKLMAMCKVRQAVNYRNILTDNGKEEAKEFAKKIYRGFHGTGSSQLPSHRQLPPPMDIKNHKDMKPTVRVLFVDDNPHWLEWFKPLVEYFNKSNSEFNIEMVLATDPSTALKKIQDEKFEAVILDYMLEEENPLSAVELAIKIRRFQREKNINFPVFGLTGKLPSFSLKGEWDTIYQDWLVDRCFYKKADEGSEPYELLLAIADSIQNNMASPINHFQPLVTLSILLVGTNIGNISKILTSIDSYNDRNESFVFDVDGPVGTYGAERFLSRPRLYGVIFDQENISAPADTIQSLIDKIYSTRPEIPVFVFNDGQYKFGDEIIGPLDNVLQCIVDNVKFRYETPFFSALINYSKRPTVVFHALPLSRGKSVASSKWACDFAEFYGEGYFAGETSTTMKPLDSLLNPEYTLKRSMELAAKAFYAEYSKFVTNGTTGANLIVYRTHIRPSDVVILDRNCHQSHHYAAIHCGARVAYMEPHHLHKYGISTLVSIDTIKNTLKRFERGQIRMIALTHPTFDGVCYDPETIMRVVHNFDPNIVLLFDEAWFAYAVFHPATRLRSAMFASQKLKAEGVECRVYVTQSIHKTLSAMRQGSMIHIRDPKFDLLTQIALDEAMIACTTTSPNVHILGSLDVARMQADLEGFDQLNRALAIAAWIRSELKDGPVRVLLEKELTEDLSKDTNPMLDQLKITLFSEKLSGIKLRQILNNEKIQVNKYSHNNVLILLTTGTTWSMADHLIRVVKRINSGIGIKYSIDYEDLTIPSFTGFHDIYLSKEDSLTGNEGVGHISRAYSDALSDDMETFKIDLGKTDEFGDPSNLAAATIVAPYPPGYPVLVPGQKINHECLNYLRKFVAKNANIHGVYEKHLHCLKVL